MVSKEIIDVKGEQYMNTKVASRYWDVKAGHVARLCRDEKVPRAIKIKGRLWYMPIDSIKPMTDNEIRKILFLTVELKNDPTYRIDYEELSIQQEQLPAVYEYLAETRYINKYGEEIRNEDLPYKVVLTSKGINLLKTHETVFLDYDLNKTILMWAGIISKVFEYIHQN